MSVLKPLQYKRMEARSISDFMFDGDASKVTKSSRKRMKRIGVEHATLADSLPLSASSSVFVRFPQSRFDTLRVAITGPEDTPYSGGVFLFDVFFPETYPFKPPLVWLKTTGNGTVRFNPNLYANGKVCLSLLGTWSGVQGEGWDPKISTLAQVLISIQSLILVENPYFNEPSYERQMHTPEGTSRSTGYDDNLKPHTVELAMVRMMRRPPEGFADVVKAHFSLRKAELLKQVEAWTRDLEDRESKHAARMRRALKELTAAYAHLGW